METTTRSRSEQILLAALVFIAWTVSSFLCQETAKLFLITSLRSGQDGPTMPFYRFILAAILTTVQSIACLLIVQVQFATKNTQSTNAITLLKISHVMATLATNYSMAYIEAASTLAIKLTEPIIMALVHHVVFRTSVPLQTALSIPLIICGALAFTSSRMPGTSDSIGITLAFASNIILAARNVTLKKLQSDSSGTSTVVLRQSRNIFLVLFLQAICVAVLHFLEKTGGIPKNWSILVSLSTASGVFHVIYSYISTSIVLKTMDVVSHSIANIFKRFLVVLLLSSFGSRSVSSINILGLVVAVCGLLVYSHRKMGVEKSVDDGSCGDKTSGRRFPRKIMIPALGFVAVMLIMTLVSIGRSTLYFHSVSRSLPHNSYRESHGMYGVETPLTDFSYLMDSETDPDMREFLSWRLIDHPEEADKRAPTLTTSKEVVQEAQRVLINLLQDLLGNVKHVMLIEIATYENKGDPAITVGEVMLLRRLNISIVYYCQTFTCRKPSRMKEAVQINQKYAKNELVILMQGGGNLVGYTVCDKIRHQYLDLFPDRKTILFSQSIWLSLTSDATLNYSRQVYTNRSNLVMFLRDRQSLEIARANFKGVKLILAPDMAFGIGMVPRQLPPLYDIVWLKRRDSESSNYALPSFPPDIVINVTDWRSWTANSGTTEMEDSFLIATEGFNFLQRGRIVVTDRLHGHILSTMMDIPHVLIDNPPHLKLSSFDKSWTKSLRNTVMVSNGSLALEAAKELLKRYHNLLPSLGHKEMYATRRTKRKRLNKTV